MAKWAMRALLVLSAASMALAVAPSVGASPNTSNQIPQTSNSNNDSRYQDKGKDKDKGKMRDLPRVRSGHQQGQPAQPCGSRSANRPTTRATATTAETSSRLLRKAAPSTGTTLPTSRPKPGRSATTSSSISRAVRGARSSASRSTVRRSKAARSECGAAACVGEGPDSRRRSWEHDRVHVSQAVHRVGDRDQLREAATLVRFTGGGPVAGPSATLHRSPASAACRAASPPQAASPLPAARAPRSPLSSSGSGWHRRSVWPPSVACATAPADSDERRPRQPARQRHRSPQHRQLGHHDPRSTARIRVGISVRSGRLR